VLREGVLELLRGGLVEGYPARAFLDVGVLVEALRTCVAVNE
jgi:hypothetical protein